MIQRPFFSTSQVPIEAKHEVGKLVARPYNFGHFAISFCIVVRSSHGYVPRTDVILEICYVVEPCELNFGFMA